jgi:C1A family cysteine protease
MKLFVLLVAISVVVSSKTLEEDQADWILFKTTYSKKYNAEEEIKRFECFRNNMIKAEILNAREPDATFGITKFSATYPDEWKKMQGFKKIEGIPRTIKPLVPEEDLVKYLAQTIDWRAKGAVSSVKDQGHCGSCWSFATADAVEGAWVAAGGNLTSLSSQELVDCTVATMPKTCPGCFDGLECLQRGCNGGDMHHALLWVVKNKGLAAYADYPYTSGSDPSPKWCKFGFCTDHQHNPIAATVGIAKDEAQILAALISGGPLSISVDASDLQHYKGGIMRSCSSAVPDHGVGLVGYQLDGSGKGYWIVKNSWNANWGEKGYFRAEYGSNQCDINNWVNQAVVKKL